MMRCSRRRIAKARLSPLVFEFAAGVAASAAYERSPFECLNLRSIGETFEIKFDLEFDSNSNVLLNFSMLSAESLQQRTFACFVAVLSLVACAARKNLSSFSNNKPSKTAPAKIERRKSEKRIKSE